MPQPTVPTYEYSCLQFLAEMNIGGSKTPIIFINLISMNKYLFLCGSLHNTMLWLQNTFNIIPSYTLMIVSHNQLYIYGFSDVVNLLSSSPGTAL